MPRNDHLCNSHAASDPEGLLAEVDQDDPDLAPVVGVDRAGGVGHGDAVLGGQAGTGPDLGLEARRQGDRDPGRDDAPLQRPDLDILVDRRQQVGARGGGRRVIRQLKIAPVRQANDFDLDGLWPCHCVTTPRP